MGVVRNVVKMEFLDFPVYDFYLHPMHSAQVSEIIQAEVENFYRKESLYQPLGKKLVLYLVCSLIRKKMIHKEWLAFEEI